MVGGATVDDDDCVGKRAMQPGKRLVPVAAPGDHLADHRVELRRYHVALGHARVDAQAGTGGQPQER